MGGLKASKGTLNERVAGLGQEIVMDRSKLNSVLKKLFKELEATEAQVEHFMDEAVLRLHRSIKLDTPVDTGAARAAWGRLPGRKKTKKGVTYTIANKMEYIVYLEFGSSRQAPHGMVRRNLRRFSKFVERELLRRSLKKAGKA